MLYLLFRINVHVGITSAPLEIFLSSVNTKTRQPIRDGDN